jgi:hypothetical protein
MTTYKDLSTFSVGVVLLASSFFSEGISAASLDLTVQPASIQPGERALLEIRLKGEDAPTTADKLELFDDLLTQNKNILVLDRSEGFEEGGLVIRYQLTAYKPGTLSLPPIQLRYPGNTLSTQATPFQVATTRSEGDEELRPEYGELSLPFPWSALLRLVVFAALLYGLFYFVKEWLSRLPPLNLRKKLKRSRAKPEDPLRWLHAQIARLKKRLEEEEESDELIDDWSQVLREYYQRKTGLPVKAWTTGECETKLKSEPTVPPLLPYFRECDSFKFTASSLSSASELLVRCLTHTERAVLKCGT